VGKPQNAKSQHNPGTNSEQTERILMHLIFYGFLWVKSTTFHFIFCVSGTNYRVIFCDFCEMKGLGVQKMNKPGFPGLSSYIYGGFSR
jgi:hypothetical protein